jgi:Acetoacetate decarboxylase (ADC)
VHNDITPSDSEAAHIAWCDPPWLITGRSLTAWFPIPRAVFEASVPAYVRPNLDEPWARLRFYDARFEARGAGADSPLAPRTGRFREAVVAFPGVAGDREGDATMFMWADDEPYTTWGREVYGWPILRGDITLGGAVWNEPLHTGAVGWVHLRAAAGTAALNGVVLGNPIESTTSGGWWITPWRRLERAGLNGERVDIVATRPNLVNAGHAYAAQGAIQFEFLPGHPLHGLCANADRAVVVDGFELLVGGEVEISEQSTQPSC